MKNLLYIILFTLSTTANSQVLLSLLFGDKLNADGLEFGLEGGANWSDISNIGSGNSLRNYNLGFYFDVRLKNKLSLNTGVLVKSNLGSNNLTDEDLTFLEIAKEPEQGRYSQELSYFIVPILAKYNFKNRIYLEAGPQVALLRNAHVEFNHKSEIETIKIEIDNTDKLNRIDAGITLGTGYRLRKKNGLTIGVKYYMGMTNIYKTRNDTKNNALFLKVNLPIGANEAKEKRKENSDKT